MQLRALVYEEDCSTVLRLIGPLTRHSVLSMEDPLVCVLQPLGQRLVLDLGKVSECDSAGAAALLGIWRINRDRAGEACFARPAPAVRFWLRLAAFHEIPIYRTVGGADRADVRQRMDPIAVVVPQSRREARPRPHGASHHGTSHHGTSHHGTSYGASYGAAHGEGPHRGARPSNAADAVYARPRRRPRT